MNNLIRTEWLKIRKYPAFWWLFAITAISYPAINYMFFKIYQEITREDSNTTSIMEKIIGNPFEFPEAWHTVAFFSSLFIFIPAVLVIMFITNEYNYKTHRQNIIDGWSRNQFMAAKLIDVLLVSLLVTLVYTIVSIVTGLTNSDPGYNLFEQSYYIGLFALQTFSQLSLAFMVGFLIKKAFISLGVVLFYFQIFEQILVELLRWKVNDIGRYLPLEISDRLIPKAAFMGKFDQKNYDLQIEAIPTHILLTIVVTSLIWFICFSLNKRRDL